MRRLGEPMRLLVCGGRDFEDWTWLRQTLDRYAGDATVLICGMATGADLLALQWARQRGIEVLEFVPDWKRYGPSAGPIRNLAMLTEGKPDFVVAFPGGRGTRNMLQLAENAGIPRLLMRPKGGFGPPV